MSTLNLLSATQNVMSLAMVRHGIHARNLAHADTPGYKALIPSSDNFSRDTSGPNTALRTRPGHIVFEAPLFSGVDTTTNTNASPNGNSVSLETEMAALTKNRQDFLLATSAYKKTVGIFRTSLGR